MIQTLANFFLIIAALGAATFVVVYQVVADWRSTSIGRNVMAFMLVTMLLLTVGILRNFVPWVDGNIEAIRLVAYVLVAGIIWHRVYLLVLAQWKGKE